MAEVRHVDAQEFEQLVNADGVVLADFYADWCMPCKMMEPVLEKLAAHYGQITVAKINVDEEPELAAEYGIQSIPALFLFKNGEVAQELIGVRPYEEIAALIDQTL